MSRKKGKKILTPFEKAAIMNEETVNDYLVRIRKIATSIFEWVNLPSSMDARYIEQCLYFTGTAALLHTEEYGFINTKAACDGDLTIYGLPSAINCYSYSFNDVRNVYNGLIEGISEDKNSEAILVMNTWDRTPTVATINLFAERLAEADRTCDVNIKAQKTPLVILIDKQQELSLKNAYAQIDGNTPIIFGDNNQLDLKKIQALNTSAPYVVDKIMEYKKEIWNEMLSYLGINNLSEKKERLISDETNSNNELINMNLQSYLAPRKKACEQFNEKFGLTGDNTIDVKVRSDLLNIIKNEGSAVFDEYGSKPKEEVTEDE